MLLELYQLLLVALDWHPGLLAVGERLGGAGGGVVGQGPAVLEDVDLLDELLFLERVRVVAFMHFAAQLVPLLLHPEELLLELEDQVLLLGQLLIELLDQLLVVLHHLLFLPQRPKLPLETALQLLQVAEQGLVDTRTVPACISGPLEQLSEGSHHLLQLQGHHALYLPNALADFGDQLLALEGRPGEGLGLWNFEEELAIQEADFFWPAVYIRNAHVVESVRED